MTIHHVSIPVSSLAASQKFYTAVLSALEYNLYLALPQTIGFTNPKMGPDFWLTGPVSKEKISGNHVAFVAGSRERVDQWHAGALKEGATCNGPPGVRAQFGKNYYAAFVLDPDGHNIEAVFDGKVE